MGGRILWGKTATCYDSSDMSPFALEVFARISGQEGVSVTQMCSRFDGVSRRRMYRALRQLERRGLLKGWARGGKSDLLEHQSLELVWKLAEAHR